MTNIKRTIIACLLALAACNSAPSLENYWEGVSPQWIVEDMEAAEKHFVGWVERLKKAPQDVQEQSIDGLVEMMAGDEVCSLVYTEWAIGHLYGLWSENRNESAYYYLLGRVVGDERFEVVDKVEMRRLMGLLEHNRVGSEAEDFVLFDGAAVTSSLEEWRGREVLMLMVDVTCPSCIDMIERVESSKKIMTAARSGELTLLVLAMGTHPEHLTPLAKAHGPKGWKVRCAEFGALAEAHYDITASPMLWLLDGRGKVKVSMTRNVKEIEKHF